MKYALIKDGVVKEVIVAEPDYISTIVSQWDYCVRVDNVATPQKWTKVGEEDRFESPPEEEFETWIHVPGIPEPGVGWSYDGDNFTPPVGE